MRGYKGFNYKFQATFNHPCAISKPVVSMGLAMLFIYLVPINSDNLPKDCGIIAWIRDS